MNLINIPAEARSTQAKDARAGGTSYRMFSWLKKHRPGAHGHIDRNSRGGLSSSAPDLTEEDSPRQPIQLEKVFLHTVTASRDNSEGRFVSRPTI